MTVNALWIYVEKHFDKTIKDYVDLLDLLVNSKIPLEATAHPSAYPNLIKNLSEIYVSRKGDRKAALYKDENKNC